MSREGFVSGDRICLWIRNHGEEFVPFWDYIAIFRLVDRGENSTIILQCLLPRGLEVANNMGPDTIIDVRYVAMGRMDNPRNGKTICYIRRVERREQWFKRLTRLEYSDEITTLYLHARCHIDWVL